MSKAIVIFNPYAGRWKAQALRQQAEAALRSAGIDYELRLCTQRGHASELAAQAVEQGARPIIAAGGDGSLNEVVNGIARALPGPEDEWPPLGVLPLGTANDLVRNLGMTTDLTQAARVIAAGRVRWIDLCSVHYTQSAGADLDTRSFFANNSAVGLEPTITILQEGISWLQGPPRYLLAALLGIWNNRAWTVQMEWEGGEYHGPISLISVGNTPMTGGMFYMTPHASPTDGKLNFVHGYVPSRLKMLSILPRTLKKGAGSYVELPYVHEESSPWLNIRFEEATPLHADGEVLAHRVYALQYRTLPGRLPLLLP